MQYRSVPYFLFVMWYYDFTIHFLHSKWRKRKFYRKFISMASVFQQNLITDLHLAHFLKLDCLFRYFLTFPHIGIFRSPGTEKSKNHTLMKYKKKTRYISQQVSYRPVFCISIQEFQKLFLKEHNSQGKNAFNYNFLCFAAKSSRLSMKHVM